MSKIITITDFNDTALDVYARLSENDLLNRANLSEGMFIAESPKVIERALNAGYEPVSLLVEDKHIDGEAADIVHRLLTADKPVYTAPFDVLTRLTGFNLTRGALCCMKRPALKSLKELCSGLKRIAVLEDVVNPTNVGAIIRSAAALNIEAVILTPNCSDPLYRRSARVSMGTVFQVPWTKLEKPHKHYDGTPVPEVWPELGMETLKNMGFKTAAMALTDDSVSVDDMEVRSSEKLAIILGTEGEGLMQKTIDLCDYTVKIPMTNGVDSLNVAAASAVAFWQLTR